MSRTASLTSGKIVTLMCAIVFIRLDIPFESETGFSMELVAVHG